MPAQHMKVPKWARCHASATHEGSQMSSVPCQHNTWRLPNKLDAMSAQYMKAPERAQKLLVQALEETVRHVKFFLKANSVIEEQKSTVRFAGTCSWSDCISSPNISSFVGHGLMNGAVAPCSAFTSRVKVRMYMSLCLHVIAGFTHTHMDICIYGYVFSLCIIIGWSWFGSKHHSLLGILHQVAYNDAVPKFPRGEGAGVVCRMRGPNLNKDVETGLFVITRWSPSKLQITTVLHCMIIEHVGLYIKWLLYNWNNRWAMMWLRVPQIVGQNALFADTHAPVEKALLGQY